MPTVPPTCVFLDKDAVVVPGIAAQITVPDASNGPTPDPDLDDVVLVPVVTGDGMGAITSPSSLDKAPAHTKTKWTPRLSLGDLTLHSPSSILGTPFDVSEPRFEYPFPETVPDLEFFPTASLPTFTGHISSFASSVSVPPPPPLANTSLTRHESTKAFSPTLLKLQARDPPVPPSLAKKRMSVGISAPPPSLTRPRSPSVKTKQGERGITNSHVNEGRKSVPARKSTLRGDPARNACSAGPDIKPTISPEDLPVAMHLSTLDVLKTTPSSDSQRLPISQDSIFPSPVTADVADTGTT